MYTIDNKFWKKRRVFLTGHTGFKGSWLSLWLAALGAEVTGYSLEPPTQPNLFEQADIADMVKTIHADIRDYQNVRNVLRESRPEIIIHMAAQSVVRKGYDDPLETYSTNVMGTANLLEAVRQIGQACVVVNVTSDKCYENREWPWGYRENDMLGGHDPYSNSKACSELVTSAFSRSYFSSREKDSRSIAVATARAGNVIGGGDWTRDQLIPDLMRAFIGHSACQIRNPLAVRPWQFVLEPLRGYLMLAERLYHEPAKFCTAWNFGPADDDAKPVSWIADGLVRAWGHEASWQKDTTQHPHEANYLKLDISKTSSNLGWQPALPLKQALEWIVEWYRAYQKGGDIRSLTLDQIKRYEAILSA